MRKIYFVIGLLIVAAMLAACGTSKTTKGAVVGGAAGGVIGNQVGDGSRNATVAGTILGALIGGGIGRSMDNRDREQAALALENRQTGQASTWTNPDTGTEYTFVPTRTYHADERPCREYTMDAVVDGRVEQVRGTACRRSDGTWEIVNQSGL